MIHAAPTQSALSAEGPSNPVPRPIVKDRAHGNDDGQRDGQGAAEVLALPFASVLQGLQQSLAPVGTLEIGKESSPATGGHPGEAARPAKDPLTSTGVVLAGGAWALPVDLPAEQRRQVGSDATRSDLPRPSGDGEAANREEPLRSGADLAEPAPTEAEPGPTIAGRPAPLAIPFEVPDTRHVVAYDVADPATARRHAPTPVDGAPTAPREGIPSMESAGDKVQPDLAEKHATPAIDRRQGSDAPGTSTSGWRAVATSSSPLRASTPGASHGAAIIHPELPGHQAPNHARPPSPSPDAAPSASSIVASDDANLTSPHEQTDDGNATRGNDGANTGYLLRNPSRGR